MNYNELKLLHFFTKIEDKTARLVIVNLINQWANLNNGYGLPYAALHRSKPYALCVGTAILQRPVPSLHYHAVFPGE